MARLADRAIGVAAGLAGAAGVALSAAGAHTAGGNLGTAGTMLLLHAAALVALASQGAAADIGRRLAALAILVGVALFSGDLAARAFLGDPLFPMAAPTGGVVMIGGWILAALAFLVGRRGRSG